MKILIIGFAKIKYMPYLRFYLDNISADNDVTVAYWNRDCTSEDLSGYPFVKYREMSHYMEDGISRLAKLGGFRRFKKFARQALLSDDFDLVICLHTFPCVLLSRYLLKNYSGRYIFDYRDSTYESFAPFKRLIGRLVKNSKYTFVSSDGFRRLLPAEASEKIYTSHNILLDSLSHRDVRSENAAEYGKIRIAYWGIIRGEKINCRIIDCLGSDSRFELHYYGREQQEGAAIKKHAASVGADNVFFHGEYVAKDRYDFVCETDVILNMFDDKNMMIAVSNKFYDGMIFRIPQLCFTGSAMADAVERGGIGIALDPYSDGFADKIYEYYNSLDRREFDRSCDEQTERVMLEYDNGCSVIRGATSHSCER